MDSILQQVKERREALGFRQSDMLLRIGISRQQYQRLEAKGNPRLDTLELIAKGLNSEVVLIPKEKLNAVLAILNTDDANVSAASDKQQLFDEEKDYSIDPWQGLLGDET
ncbi:MAG: helix-turn-helix transcriptional regulator [Pseudomonas sp.]|jgi:transcriptional regulator with XRE-family HTH domain|nr:helix-turn-helix transcriptional regulator [Pseudomonas sp.]